MKQEDKHFASSSGERQKVIKSFLKVSGETKKTLKELLCVIAEVCDVPVAIVTLMDSNYQWFVCAKGTDATGNSVSESFCQYLNPKPGILEVPDARADERFMNLEAVKGPYQIRFYAGVPLISKEKLLVGSVCLFDQRVKTLSNIQKNCLKVLSGQVIKILEQQRTEETNKSVAAELQIQKDKTESLLQKLRAYFDSSPSIHILLDLNMNVLDFNKEAVIIIRKFLGKQVLYEKSVLNYVTEDYAKYFIKFFNIALKGKRIARDVQIKYEGIMIWWRITLRPILDDNHNVVAIAYSAMNIHQTREYIEEITRQNKSLQEIALIQSHEYRKPVASILGLLNLIKLDRLSVSEEILNMMETAVRELDDQIKKVVEYSEKSL